MHCESATYSRLRAHAWCRPAICLGVQLAEALVELAHSTRQGKLADGRVPDAGLVGLLCGRRRSRCRGGCRSAGAGAAVSRRRIRRCTCQNTVHCPMCRLWMQAIVCRLCMQATCILHAAYPRLSSNCETQERYLLHSPDLRLCRLAAWPVPLRARPALPLRFWTPAPCSDTRGTSAALSP